MCYTSAGSAAVATVACRETTGTFAYSIQAGSASSYQGVRYVGITLCQGDEVSLTACNQRLFSIFRCPSGDTIITCSTGWHLHTPTHVHTYTHTHVHNYIAIIGCWHVLGGWGGDNFLLSNMVFADNGLVMAFYFILKLYPMCAVSLC